jgi:hypothetical protein
VKKIKKENGPKCDSFFWFEVLKRHARKSRI